MASHALTRFRTLKRRASSARPIVIKTVQKAAKHARRGARAASSEKHRMGAILGGAALGYIDKPGGMLSSMPTLPFLGRAGTAGLVCYAAAKQFRSPTLDHMCTGMLAIAAYELTKEGHISGEDL